MTQAPIRFDDGAGYERAMGVWSRIAGEVFLDWVALAAMPPTEAEAFKARVQARLSVDASGQVTCHARANAITGRVRNV